jgi:hypothetical protein
MTNTDTFDTILDKPLIDFQREVDKIESLNSKSKLLEMLTDDVKREMKTKTHNPNEIQDKIKNVYDFNNIESSFELLNYTNGQFNYQYAKLQQAHYDMKDAQDDGDLLTLDTCALDGGAYALYILTVLIIMKRYHEKFNVGDFLFCLLDFELQSDGFEDLAAHVICTALKQSRINYILNNTYLPVICVMIGF